MKLISWNVNGLRANIKKGFYDTFTALDADVFAIQESKLQAGQVDLEIPASYHQTWSYAERKGYSGTAVFSREEPLRALHKLGLKPGDGKIFGAADPTIVDNEGRLCAVEFERYWFVNCYTPNAQDGLARIALRLAWGAAFTRFVAKLAKDKPVVICGDLNVAHNEIDLKNPGPNRGNAGFSDEERDDFSALLAAGFTDSFRHLYPTLAGAYSWWSFRGNARANNTGWRIDYFLVSNSLAEAGAITEASIYPEVYGSDHCPVGLELEL
ncbi:MAG: exodeoxyribonuclease III [Coriobacteriales bacterium]|jgi:exodeoxyribonuclease-3|nr:exodeoxyribonuclease III [Coriobacteriales bacterium]